MATENGSHVLIVDDEPKNLQVLGSLLRKQKFEVTFATHGEEALEALRQSLPDLILLDIMMPGMDGYEVCRKLKSQRVTARIPVIFLTARADTDDVVRGFEAGCVDYIAKPFRSAELLARVNTHIQLKKLRGLLPICMYCRKIRNDQDYWMKIEVFLRQQTGADLSHGICPECLAKTLKQEGLAG